MDIAAFTSCNITAIDNTKIDPFNDPARTPLETIFTAYQICSKHENPLISGTFSAFSDYECSTKRFNLAANGYYTSLYDKFCDSKNSSTTLLEKIDFSRRETWDTKWDNWFCDSVVVSYGYSRFFLT